MQRRITLFGILGAGCWAHPPAPTSPRKLPNAKPGEPELPYNIFDPYIWKQGEYYYALTAGRKPIPESGNPVRAEFLHRSKDLANWEYLHPFLEGDHYGLVGDDGACPYFWPIGNKHILLHFSHMSGGKYLLGNYDTQRDKFVVTDGGDFNHGPVGPGGVHAPSACPDGQGGVIAIFNVNAAKPTQAWNQLMTLPMRLTLAPPGEPDPLRIEPAGDILTGFPVFAILEVTLATGLLASANRACRATAEVARNQTVALAVFPGVCT